MMIEFEITEEETMNLYGQVCLLELRIRQVEEKLPRRLDEKYMDNQDFIFLLNIDKSRSREWRRLKLVPFSAIRGKFYYPIREVDQLLSKSIIRKSALKGGKKKRALLRL